MTAANTTNTIRVAREALVDGAADGDFDLMELGPDQVSTPAALAAVQTYARLIGDTSEEPETVLADLLGDLRHLAAHIGVDFDECAETGDRHYREETAPIPYLLVTPTSDSSSNEEKAGRR